MRKYLLSTLSICGVYAAKVSENINWLHQLREAARYILVKETKRQGRIAHHHTDATVPHIVALLGFSFHAANIRRFFVTSKYYGIYFMFWAEIGGRIQPCDWIKLCNIGTVLLLHDNEE